MHFVIFGLTVSSSWGNGHATLWRGLLKALARRGHTVRFYEKDVPYYADTRDGWAPPPGVELRLFAEWDEARAEVRRALEDADVAMVTSYCGEGAAVCQAVLEAPRAVRVFYDLDTPVTLSALEQGQQVPYLPQEGLGEFDLVLSYTGGRALDELRSRLGARRTAPLYGWVDPEIHQPAEPVAEFRSDLSYLGTFAPDRQATLEELFVRTARECPSRRFAMGGAQYPENFPWADNIFFVRHLPPPLHAAFFCSSRATLNVTRAAMAEYGFCPSGRLFEAAACGTPLLTDTWEGLDSFFTPGEEILCVRGSADVQAALSRTDTELERIAARARQRTLCEHTAEARAIELERLLDDAAADRDLSVQPSLSAAL